MPPLWDACLYHRPDLQKRTSQRPPCRRSAPDWKQSSGDEAWNHWAKAGQSLASPGLLRPLAEHRVRSHLRTSDVPLLRSRPPNAGAASNRVFCPFCWLMCPRHLGSVWQTVNIYWWMSITPSFLTKTRSQLRIVLDLTLPGLAAWIRERSTQV